MHHDNMTKIIRCLSFAEAVPVPLIYWAARAEAFQTQDELPASRLADIGVELCSLRASIHNGIATGTENITQAAALIDQQLQNWVANVPSSWAFTSWTTRVDSDKVYERQFHTYPAVSIVSAWNIYRVFRILTNETLYDALTSSMTSPASQSPLHGQCIEIFAKMSSELCCSVPFLFDQPDVSEVTSPERYDVPTSSLATKGASTLMWPLYVLGGMDTAPREVRHWAIGKLDSIGQRTGIKLAQALVRLLQDRETELTHGRYSKRPSGVKHP